MIFEDITEDEINTADYALLYRLINDTDVTEITLLKRTENLGRDMDFSEAVPLLIRSRELCLIATPQIIEDGFSGKQSKYLGWLKNWIKLVIKIRDFSVQDDNATNVRNTHISNAKKYFETAIDLFSPITAFQRYSGLKVGDEKYEKEKAQYLIDLKDITHSANEAKERAENAAKAAQGAAGQSSVSIQSGFFQTQAETHETISNRWLIVTFVSGFILILCILFFDTIFNLINSTSYIPPTIDRWIIYISSKILVLSTLGAFVVICRKSYVVNKHNQLINQHRANALKTYEALVEASENNKDTILQQAASCIFTHQETGLSKFNSANDLSMPQMILNTNT